MIKIILVKLVAKLQPKPKRKTWFVRKDHNSPWHMG